MGFCTTINPFTGREVLVCDFCSSYPARKIRCPYEWCQAWATCKECKKAGRHRNSSSDMGEFRKNHESCKIEAKKEDTLQRLKQEMLISGKFILSKCEWRDPEKFSDKDILLVSFKGLNGKTKVFEMLGETYGKLIYPRKRLATPEDYARIGGLVEVLDAN